MSSKSKELLSAIKWEGSGDKSAVLKVVGAYISHPWYWLLQTKKVNQVKVHMAC
jgi:hypothetical protein